MYLTVLYPDAIEAEKHMNEYCYSGDPNRPCQFHSDYTPGDDY